VLIVNHRMKVRNAGRTRIARVVSMLLIAAMINIGGFFVTAGTAFAAVNPTTVAATDVTSTDATLNGINGNTAAVDSSFWVSLTDGFDISTPSIPDGVYSTPVLGPVDADAAFSASLSSITTTGVPTNLPPITPNTTYYFVAWSNVDGTWFPGEILSFTTEPVEIPIPLCGDTNSFDNFSTGSVNGQDGWSATGPYDQAIVDNTYGYSSFGCKSLRISDAVTTGSFGDQIFSPSNLNEAGETDALNGGMSGGIRQNRFEAQFDLASTMSTPQPGMHISVSPDRGDGARMSYLRFEDSFAGINVFFVDVQGTTNPANFVETQIATDLSRTIPHTIKFVMDFVDGPSNDVVKIYIDNSLVHTGTSWENYYRFDPESNPSLTSNSRTVDSLLFRESGTANPTNEGNGFLIDNLSLSSGPTPPGPVCIDTNVNHLCDLGELSFNTIQAAVNAASSTFSDTIQVTAGTYPELVTVNKTVTINGAQVGVDAQNRIISVLTESVVGIPTGAFKIEANDVAIDGFSISGVVDVSIAGLGAGIHTSGSNSGHQIRNNIVSGNIMGVYLNSNGTNTTTVNQNLIRDNNAPGAASGNGIYSDQGLSNAVISDNTFTGTHANASIILVSDVSSDITITGNNLVNDGEILLVNTNGATISNNTITNSLFHGIQLAGGNNNVVVSGNVITGNNTFVTASGIRINGGPTNESPIDTNVTITNNSLTENKYGLNVNGDAATGVTVNFNDLSSNSFASLIYSPSLVPVPTLDAQNNWWGCAAGPHEPPVVPVPIADFCGLIEGNLLAIDYNPWLATLELSTGTPVVAQLFNSDIVAVGGDTGLKIKFMAEGANPQGPQIVSVDSNNTATYNINPGNLGPNPGDTTISGMVLFANQDSTLTDSFIVNTPPGGGGGGGGGGGSGGTPTPTPSPTPTPTPSASPTPTPTPFPTATPFVLGQSSQGGFQGGVGGAIPDDSVAVDFGTSTPTVSPTPSGLEFTPLPTDSDNNNGLASIFGAASTGRIILWIAFALLLILLLLWLLSRSRSDKDQGPPDQGGTT